MSTICALCKQNKADKKNTHYLTDGVIRSAFNHDGGNERESGVIYELSGNIPTVEFTFQRNTPQEKIEAVLNRIPSEEEIEKAKNNPFSVDYLFCKNCEDVFTEIESPFLQNLLPKFRTGDIKNKYKLEYEEHRATRLFIYLQIWRSHICINSIELSENTAEDLRLIITNHKSKSLSEINHYPISLTYLTTSGDSKNYTGNLVGLSNDKNPFIIHLNDFLIQFYESESQIMFTDYFGINNIVEYKKYINYKSDHLILNVLCNDERIAFNTRVGVDAKFPQLIDVLKQVADKAFIHSFRQIPPRGFSDEYVRRVVNNPDERKFSTEKTYEVLTKFLIEIIYSRMR